MVQQEPGGAQPAPMTAERLAAIQARADKATPGPWYGNGGIGVGEGRERIFSHSSAVDIAMSPPILGNDVTQILKNMDFITLARTDIPDLLAYVASLRAALSLTGEACEAALRDFEFFADHADLDEGKDMGLSVPMLRTAIAALKAVQR